MSVYGFRAVDNLYEYTSYTYSFNFLTAFALLTGVYTIFSFYITIRMCIFYLNRREAVKNGLRADVFRLFLMMQVWNAFHVFLDFLIVRIPLTSIFTAYCAQSKPEVLLKTLTMLFTGFAYASHILTLMFCLQRVLLIYATEYQKETISKVLDVLCPLLALLAHCLGIPHVLTKNSCFQMASPFPFGAVVITSSRDRHDVPIYTIIYLICIHLMILLILATTCLMFAKLNQKRRMSSELNTKYNSTAEKTLTATMVLILLPIVMPAILSFAAILNYTFYSHLFLLRSLCLDARAHVVSIYFYYTHPIFKSKRSESKVVGSNGL
uniref:Serpentine receptor class gamma n=1 Tax=Caenorhabditis japonica TaxID=281687 RepID=A0A8R1DIL4_CAEJA